PALAYKYSRKSWLAGFGEVFGTGILASLIAVPYAKLLMETSVAALFFMPAFLTSSTIGAILGVMVASTLRKSVLVKSFNSSLY
ncbi:MAG TPA: energy coupling factor transporter S component ThiW, partial [Lysinibacillus sp.]|nr:energy coupling factor transporter S component ThiW [Lysinibacillus sp.]